MSYTAQRFKAGRSGWAVVMTVHSPNGTRTIVKTNLTKAQAHECADIFNREVGNVA